MRRAIMIVAVVALLASAGCSRAATSSVAQHDPSKFVVLGSTSGSGVAAGAAPAPRVSANSLPRRAFAGMPGADRIVVVSGAPAESRQQAVERARKGLSAGATLVSAVYVSLPTEFVGAALKDPKRAKAKLAWIVTYTGVPRLSGGPAGSGKGRLARGSATIVLDAASGDAILRVDYPELQ